MCLQKEITIIMRALAYEIYAAVEPLDCSILRSIWSLYRDIEMYTIEGVYLNLFMQYWRITNRTSNMKRIFLNVHHLLQS